MPLTGHAWFGLGTAICTRPAERTSAGAALWTPIMIGLAYLPDIAYQAARWAGVAQPRPVTHSALFAVIASLVLAPGVAALTRTARRRAFALSLFLILTHCALDFLEQPGPLLWWPARGWLPPPDWGIIPANPFYEGFLFGWIFLVVLTGYYAFFRKRRPGERVNPPPASSAYVRTLWIGRAGTLLIILAVLVTAGMRATREKQILAARKALWTHQDNTGALTLLSEAERWPGVVNPAEAHLMRGTAYDRLGDRRIAEQYYLRSIEANPRYFWPIRGLVLLYATGPEPLAERRRRIAPYVERMRQTCPKRESLSGYLKQVERRLGAPIEPTATGTAPGR